MSHPRIEELDTNKILDALRLALTRLVEAEEVDAEAMSGELDALAEVARAAWALQGQQEPLRLRRE